MGRSSIDVARLEKALSLFGPGDGPDGLDTLQVGLCSLGADVGDRAFRKVDQAQQPDVCAHWLRIRDKTQDVMNRLSDVTLRTRQVEWIQQQRAAVDGSYGYLDKYVEMAVKDFHSDLFSLMNALAPVVAQAHAATPVFKPHEEPVFADINGYASSGKARQLRESVPHSLLEIVDATQTWWTPVRKVRNQLIHGRHTTLSFRPAREQLLFQVYDDSHHPLIVGDEVLWPEGANIVDFSAYSASVVGQILCCLDELGDALAQHLGVTLRRNMMTFIGDYGDLVTSMRRVVERINCEDECA